MSERKQWCQIFMCTHVMYAAKLVSCCAYYAAVLSWASWWWLIGKGIGRNFVDGECAQSRHKTTPTSGILIPGWALSCFFWVEYVTRFEAVWRLLSTKHLWFHCHSRDSRCTAQECCGNVCTITQSRCGLQAFSHTTETPNWKFLDPPLQLATEMHTASQEQVLGRAVQGLADMSHVDIQIISTLNPDMELIRQSHHTPPVASFTGRKEMMPQDGF